MPQAPKTLNNFDSLIQIISDLRGPEGCPWDKEQTHKSLAPYAIEETHEMTEAIESGDDAHMCEELGDVLFQVVIHAELARERGAFDISHVIESIAKKIVRRHPHVFSDVKVKNSAEVVANWSAIKKIEKENKKKQETLFNVPPSLPALQRSFKIGEITEKYNFDWSEPKQVLAQLKAEITELEEALSEPQGSLRQQHLEHEIGDVLFSAAQLARHLDSEPESNLRDANRRFINRFEKMIEKIGSLDGFVNLSSADKEILWNQVKKEI